MVDSKAGKPTLARYLLLGLVGILVIYVGTGFMRQAQVREQQRAALERVEQELLFAQEDAERLQKHLEFVESPAAVEAWALENGWARPDEMPVVLVEPPGEPLPGSEVQTRGETGLPAPQQAWWELFFGHR